MICQGDFPSTSRSMSFAHNVAKHSSCIKKVPEKCYNDKEMWSLFIATSDEEVIDMLANENQDIKKAVEKLEYVSSDRDERFRIDQIDKARIDHLAAFVLYF